MNNKQEPKGWSKRYDEEFNMTGSPHKIGYTMVPGPTNAGLVVKEFISLVEQEALERGRNEVFGLLSCYPKLVSKELADLIAKRFTTK